jgi:ribose transport system permease protein
MLQSFRRLSVIYVMVILWFIFTAIDPQTFPRYSTVQIIVNGSAVVGLIALAIVTPLAAGLYDFSVGANAGLAGIATAWTLAHTGANIEFAFFVGIATGVVVGMVNAVIVVGLRVDSFIGTLAVSAVVTAAVLAVSNGSPIVGPISGAFSRAMAYSALGLTLPVWLMFGVVLLLAYLLQATSGGRYIQAVGFNKKAATLAGVRVSFVQVMALIISGLIAGLAGVCEAGILGAGSPTVGPGYLLPAYAAAFVGATQFIPGRFNAWGALAGTLLLQLGAVGLTIAGAQSWAASLYEGVVLILAVAFGVQRDRSRKRKVNAEALPKSTT